MTVISYEYFIVIMNRIADVSRTMKNDTTSSYAPFR
uniref:Uncharacterized protein n=1 Tax=Schistosoma japonicum TaxID=6182 RepID=Q5C4A0_SCHJA|nr:unknown [Schistosoma japonicum]